MAETKKHREGSRHDRRQHARPPEPPEHRPRTRIPRGQMIGVPLIMLLPVLAIAGVFSDRKAVATGAFESLRISVEYPARTRYRVANTLSAWVVNESNATMDTVFVSLDPGYVEHFTDVAFIPDVSEAYELELTDIAPGERRFVRIELRADRYGSHSTAISAAHDGDTARANIRTVILP